MKKKHSVEMIPLIEAAKTEGPVECGLEYQQEKGWPKLALCPIWTHRDETLEAQVNWDALLSELPDEAQYGVTRVKSGGHGWHECVHFNPCHRPTVNVLLGILQRIRENGCADPDELHERENDELIEVIESDIWHLPDGMEYDDVARAQRAGDDWEGKDSYTVAMAREEIQKIPHAYHNYFDVDDNCICDLGPDADVHHVDPEQIPGQLSLLSICEMERI